VKELSYLFTMQPMQKKHQEELMFNCYHVNDEKGIASHIEIICTGKGPYVEHYDRIANSITDPAHVAAISTKLVLKPQLHCTDKRIEAGRNIIPVVLEKATFLELSPIDLGWELTELWTSHLANNQEGNLCSS
jgi:hypothetical protein